MTLIEQIKASAEVADLDEALRPVQELIGVTDGGVASHFFSGANEASWPNAAPAWRCAVMADYIAYEIRWSV